MEPESEYTNDSEMTEDTPYFTNGGTENAGENFARNFTSARTSGDDKTVKKRRTSKAAILQAEYDNKLRCLEDNFNQKFDKLFDLFQNKSYDSQRGSLPRSDCNLSESIPSGDRRTLKNTESIPPGDR